jgi:signal transduction histidine kinase
MQDLEQISRLRRTMRRLALAVAVVTAVSIPLGFFVVSYTDQGRDLEHHGVLTSERLAQYAYSHGATWSYARERLAETMAATQSSHEDIHQVAHLPDGREVAQFGNLPAWPRLSRIAVASSFGGQVATVTVSSSLRPLLLQTALVALFALLLGGTTYVALHRLPLRALDETLGQLQVSLKTVEAHATETSYAYEELKRQHRLIEETTHELMKARDQAQTADQTKSAFLATMSHELRTPLNAIIGFSEMLTQEVFGPLSNDRYREYCGSIGESGHHLLAIINDVLDISKMEAGKLQLYFEEVDLQQLLDGSCRLVRPKVYEAGVELKLLACEPPLEPITADAVKLKQIVLNLLSNALKFTPPGGEIALGYGRTPEGGVYIRVTDSGIGMTEEEVAVALQPFQQVDNTHTRKYEGTGLGLPLAKGLAEQHGGKLEVESQPGRGTSVTIYLPVEQENSGPFQSELPEPRRANA